MERWRYGDGFLPPAVGADMASGAMTSEGLGEVFIQYMHFMRRHDGILAARRLFAERAVKGWEGCPWTVYAAAALMDWNHDRNGKAVRNIFEFGAKKFIGDPGYVQEYVSWLLAQGDDVNARNLAERALTSCEPLALRAMWDVRMGLEAELGNSSEMWRLEARRRETLGQLADHDKELDQYACLVMRHYRFAVWPGTASERLHFREAIGLAPKWAKGDSQRPSP